MSKPERKIPPLLLVIFLAIFMWVTSLFFPEIQIQTRFKVIAFVIPATIGILISIAGVVSFRAAKTTVNPMTPHTSSVLVTSGIYKRSRNPIYVGFLFLLIGWGLFLSNMFSLALTAGFILYMNRYQIQPEEEALEAIFGEEFLTYKNRVRRWL